MSLAAIAWVTLRPAHAPSTQSHLCLVCGPEGGVDVLLNILLFVPLGVGLGLIGWSGWRAVLLCCALSLAIEITQLFFIPGRAATLSDVLTNTLGATIGFWLTRSASMLLKPSRKNAAWLTAIWAALWLLIQIVSSYALSPSLPTTRYYAHIAEPFGAMFHGEVASAKIDTTPIASGAFADSRSIRQQLLNGAAIEAVVHLTAQTPNFASIIHIADDSQRAIASIAEQGDRLVYGIRTGASNLRLRQPAFGMPGVFASARSAPGSVTDTLNITARFNDGIVHLAVQNGTTHREMDFAPSAQQAWTVLVPFHGYLQSDALERVATFLWAAALLIPLGYWAARVARQSRGVVLISALSALALVLMGGLTFVPKTFGLRSAPALDWIAIIFGLAVGGVCGISSISDRQPRVL